MSTEDEELEAIRRKKLEELLVREEQERAAAEMRAEAEAQKQSILRRILAPEARERLGRLRMVKPEIVEEVERQLILLAQSGRVHTLITDKMLREILSRLVPSKREIRIERR